MIHELTRNNMKKSNWFRVVSCEFVDKLFVYCTNVVGFDLAPLIG